MTWLILTGSKAQQSTIKNKQYIYFLAYAVVGYQCNDPMTLVYRYLCVNQAGWPPIHELPGHLPCNAYHATCTSNIVLCYKPIPRHANRRVQLVKYYWISISSHAVGASNFKTIEINPITYYISTKFMCFFSWVCESHFPGIFRLFLFVFGFCLFLCVVLF